MSKTGKNHASASYRRGQLTIDLPNAAEPVLWRQEIRDVSRISFSLQHLPGGDQALVLRTEGGAEQIIASFRDPAAANEALAALRDILLNPPNPIRTALRIFLKIIKWLIILLIIILGIRLAVYYYFNMKISDAVQQNVTAEQNVTEPSSTDQNLPPGGVPLVADDVLQAPVE